MRYPMRWLYTLLVYLAAPAVILGEAWRGLRERRGDARLRQRFGFGARVGPGSTWVHAVSVGEVQAAAPLVRALLRQSSGRPVVLSTVTSTGAARARALFGDDLVLRYAPLDLPGAVHRFFERVQPDRAVIVETELWPNLLAECRRRDVPLVIASARLSPRSVARYRRLASLFGRALSGRTTIAAQSEVDAERFRSIGVDAGRVSVTGNIKFDIELPAGIREQGATWRQEQAASRPLWVAGSTHEGEEALLLDAHALLRRDVPQALLVLVPRHPGRFPAVAQMLERRGLRWERRSVAAPVDRGTEVLLGDTMGELPLFYAGADVAFVGGSLVAVGGHNLLEPAALAVPIVTGPYNFNGQEIHDKLMAAGAVSTVHDASGLAAELERLLDDPVARREQGECGLEVVAANRGAVGRVLRLVHALDDASASGQAARVY